MLYTHLLTCPVCHEPFVQTDHMLKCANAHSFDIAKEGYVNLLRKKLPGDSAEMLAARRSILEGGFYRPLSDAINELVYAQIGCDTLHLPAILDAGCGEGYYLGRLSAYLAERHCEALCVGLDVSKDAARMAARKYQDICFIVANIKERLVFADESLRAILNIFAPRNATEFARVLTPQGLLLVVIPAPEHLLQLRARLPLLSIEANKQEHVIAQFADRFALLTTQQVSYEVDLSAQEVAQVVMMTPNYWHLTDEVKSELAEIVKMRTEIAFVCLLFRRRD